MWQLRNIMTPGCTVLSLGMPLQTDSGLLFGRVVLIELAAAFGKLIAKGWKPKRTM
jgi:hypothetical protein